MPSPGQDLVYPPRFTKFVCPTYPQDHVRLQGVVLIEIAVAKNGEPSEIRAVEGHPMLISATMEAAKQWRFRPYRLNGKAVEVNMRMKLVFVAKPRSGHRCHLEHRPSPVYVHQHSDGRRYIP